MNNSMQRSALDNVIARKRGVKRKGTDRHSLSCPPQRSKPNASADILADPDRWVGICRRVSGRNRELWQTVERFRMPGRGIVVRIAHVCDHPYGVRRIAHHSNGPGDKRSWQPRDQNSRGILFASAEHHIYSPVIPGRFSSHAGHCRGL